MNTIKDHPGKDQEDGGLEIERTHKSYEKGYPAPGTRHAGEEGKDFIPANDDKKLSEEGNDDKSNDQESRSSNASQKADK